VKLPKAVRGALEFKAVKFTYPGGEAPALKNISFTAEPGKITGIIGATGSGKSSILNLIPRLYDPEEGEILLDGVNIRDLSQYDLREQLSYVPQKSVLFAGTIRSNTAYGREEASDKDLRTALETAQALEFVDAKPEGLESPIAQGGGNVSGGQKQRLAIARALAKPAQICLFDDSFSALDFRTEAKLRKALHQEAQKRTLLIVAQRVSTIMHADQILVIDEGEIIARGSHEELLRTCPPYKEIAVSQLGEKEVQ